MRIDSPTYMLTGDDFEHSDHDSLLERCFENRRHQCSFSANQIWSSSGAFIAEAIHSRSGAMQANTMWLALRSTQQKMHQEVGSRHGQAKGPETSAVWNRIRWCKRSWQLLLLVEKTSPGIRKASMSDAAASSILFGELLSYEEGFHGWDHQKSDAEQCGVTGLVVAESAAQIWHVPYASCRCAFIAQPMRMPSMPTTILGWARKTNHWWTLAWPTPRNPSSSRTSWSWLSMMISRATDFDVNGSGQKMGYRRESWMPSRFVSPNQGRTPYDSGLALSGAEESLPKHAAVRDFEVATRQRGG